MSLNINNILTNINCPFYDEVKCEEVYQYECNDEVVLGRMQVTICQCKA